ncbi:MAG TPA: tetratricopeptide repeat protein [Nitrososphaeraceae archaeon]|nr:tetratricopeptide repeat protein [Nitrososphaeraceae archaeon]HKI09964.1 tetratricopeptide repeat protein [Nitrososphaeraceae archaeon]
MNTSSPSTNLSELISEMDKVQEADHLVKCLERISTIGYYNATQYAKEGEHDKAADEYSLITSAYYKAIDLINKYPKEYSALKSIIDTLKETAKYWQKQAISSSHEDSQDKVNRYVNMGSELQSIGDYNRSIESFNNAMNSGSESPIESAKIWNEKGNSYYYSGKYTEAKESYARATELEPYNGIAWGNLGLINMQLGEYETAIQNYKEAIRLERSPSDLYLSSIGIANYHLGRYEKALEYLIQAVKINPNSVDSLVTLGAIYNDGFFDPNKAKEYFERAILIDPTSLIAKINLAEILLILSEYDRSEELSKEVRDSNNENYGFVARFFLICSLYLRHTYEDASILTLDILNYCESLPADYVIDWKFDSLSQKIKREVSNKEIYEVLFSLISLKEAIRNKDEKESILRKIRERVIVEKKWWSLERITEEMMSSNKKIKKAKIEIKNTSYPDENEEGYYFWEIRITAHTNILSEIDKVVYYLHPTFLNPIQEVDRKRDPAAEINGFRLQGRAWGEFQVKIKIILKDGSEIMKYHWLTLNGPTPLEMGSALETGNIKAETLD